MPEPYGLNLHEVAIRLNQKDVKTNLYRWLDEGQFPHAQKAGRSWLIPEADIADFLKRSTSKIFLPT